jgi:hypothetical protein
MALLITYLYILMGDRVIANHVMWSPPKVTVPLLNLVDQVFQLQGRGWIRCVLMLLIIEPSSGWWRNYPCQRHGDDSRNWLSL